MKKILIIEDDGDSRELYRQILEESNYSVLEAANGGDGLNIAQKNIPDLIILDIMLPGGINGFDALEQIKRDEKLKAIPVIVLTNLDSEEKTAREIGAVDYIVKTTASLSDIVARVKSHLG